MLSLSSGYGLVKNPMIHSPLTFYQPFQAPLLPPQNSLSFWFDGQDPAGTSIQPADDTAITPWVDKSANVISVSQGTGSKQAKFKVNIINGHPALLFTAASLQFYQRAAVRVFDNVNNYSIFAVVRPTTTAAASVILEGGNGTQTGIYALAQTSGNIRLLQRSPYAASGGDTIQTANNAITANNNFFLRFIRNGATGNQTVTSSNGITANLASLTQPALPATDMLFSVGVNGGGMSGTYFNGYIGEIIGYTKILNDYELAQLFNYIRKKWGINP